MKKLILFAVFVYFILGTITYHPDNKLVLSWASLSNGTVWNIWNVEPELLVNIGQFNYPPLHFYLDKLQYFISIPFGGNGYYDWIQDNLDPNIIQSNLTRYSFAVKFPLMLFSLSSAYLIYLIAKKNKFKENKSKVAAAIWLFNPITLYSIPIMGQNDVMAIFAFLLGWFLLQNKKLLLSSLLFGLSASIKIFPIIWVPFLLLYQKEISIKKKLGILFGSLFVYFLTLLPFLSNSNFRNSVLNTGIDRFFVSRIDLGYSDYILVVPILLMILLYGILSKIKSTQSNNIFLRQSSVLLLLNMIFLFFNHFNPQWFLWLIPFWIFWFLQQNENKLHILLATTGSILSWILVILLFNDSALSIGLLTPLNSNLSVLPPIREFLLAKDFHVSLFNNYGHSFLAGIALIFMIYWFNSEEKFINSNFIKLKSKLKLNKYLKFSSLLCVALLFIFSSTLLANLIPAPFSDVTDKPAEYPFLLKPVKKDFIATYDRLNRIDIEFSDDELKNLDDYTFQIKNDKNAVIFNQSFNGLNIGYRSYLSFKFASQKFSKDKKYTILIIPPLTSEKPLRIASASESDKEDFIFKPFYNKPSGINYIKFSLIEANISFANVLNQNKYVYILSAIALWFAL